MARLALAACLLALACASAPAPEPGRAVVFGSVELVPKRGVPEAAGYGDRRLRDVPRFDYLQPRFAVVFADAPPASAPAPAALVIEPREHGGVRFQPAYGVTGLAAGISIENRSAETRVVSAPEADFVARLAPGETAHVAPGAAGELEIHLLGERAAPAIVFVAAGAFAPVGADGRYALRGLAPGSREIRAWHPRLPPSAPHRVEVAAGEAVRLDLAIGVDLSEGHAP
jgi:hypothetical protein